MNFSLQNCLLYLNMCFLIVVMITVFYVILAQTHVSCPSPCDNVFSLLFSVLTLKASVHPRSETICKGRSRALRCYELK